MARIPAVYTTLEDRSIITEEPKTGRSGFVCILSDRGPHNKVVQINSYSQFEATFGKPNLERTGYGHYLAARFITRSNNLYVIRASWIDASQPEKSAKIANAKISRNVLDEFDTYISVTNGKYKFQNNSKIIIAEDQDSFDELNLHEWVYPKDGDVNDAQQISHKHTNGSTLEIHLENEYTGPDSVDFERITIAPSIKTTNGTFTFTNESNIVIATDESAYDELNVGDWVYPSSGTFENSYQIVHKNIETKLGIDTYELVLHEDVNLADTTETIDHYVPFSITSEPLYSLRSLVKHTSNKDLFYFGAVGTGTYYNKLFIQGIRNFTLERMYTDDDGVPLYKYIFIDITIRERNPDGSSKLIEGPWTCSLINKIGEQTVRDLNTGRELYIVSTINDRSRYIRCYEGRDAGYILGDRGNPGSEKAELARLQVMAMLSRNTVNHTKVRASDGFYLENGSDGLQYDAHDRLDLYSEEITGLMSQAYLTTLKSEDGSIALLNTTLYSWYQIDYILCGGYSLPIQDSARYLADNRDDCLVLADTGQYSINAQEDLDIRTFHQGWNTWNAAIYIQYREMVDPFNGIRIPMTPVYHAIDAHLRIDNNYFISEPVAGIEKGALMDAADLVYKPSIYEMEQLIDQELNPVITEPDGTYILTQFTSYKRLSVMKRIHAVKIIQYVRKHIPTLLKGILQRRATPYWIGVAETLVNTFLREFTNPNTMKYSFSQATSSVEFDEERSELFVSITLKPVRAIEIITVNIVVV